MAVGAFAACAAWLLTPPVRALARRMGFLDLPGAHKTHADPIPYGGGVAVALAVGLALAAGTWVYLRLLYDPAWSGQRAAWGFQSYLETARMSARPPLARVLGVSLAGALGALLFGLADDKWAFRPLTKLVFQFALAIAVVSGGVRTTALVGDGWLMQAATVLWIVLITNSFNLLDNMDGLCSGTVAITASVLALVALPGGEAPVALVAAALAGACLGFLRHNLAPANIFLGDAGSMFVGFLMACLTVVTTYYRYHESVLSIGVPVLILAIPLYDTASVLAIRLREGRPPLRGDTSHFSHRLVDLGMTRRQAVATIHLAALAIALPAAILSRLQPHEGALLIGQAFLVLTLIALLERAGVQRKRSEKQGPPADV